MPILIGVGSFILITVIVIQCTVGFGTIARWVYSKYKIRPYLTSAVCVGVLLALSCAGMYYLKTVNIEQSNQIVRIESHYYRDTFQYTVYPKNVQPDTVYEINLDGTLSFSDKVVWGENETSGRTFKHKITPAEYKLIEKNTHFNVSVFKFDSEKNILYLCIPVIYLVLCASVWWVNTFKTVPVLVKMRR